jgi:hypothetical protein
MLMTSDLARYYVPPRLWFVAAAVSVAARQDGQEMLTAATLLPWLDAVLEVPQSEVLGIERAMLLARLDVYTAQGVWAAILRDADVTMNDFHHELALRAQQLGLARRTGLTGGQRRHGFDNATDAG